VDFATFATVSQATGESWKDVRLVLSTAVPSENAAPPELGKLLVGALERPPEKKVLVRRDEFVERANAGKDQDLKESPTAKPQGLSVQLEVPERSTVTGERSPIRVLVGRAPLKAQFQLRVMPKLFPVAFRVAEVTNQNAWPLLPGGIEVYRKTGLVGHFRLDRIAQGAPVLLSFGVEESIRVKRTILDELKKDVGLFSDKKRFAYLYKFEISNYGKTNAQVMLVDHLPVSELADIAVSISPKTTAGLQLSKDEGMATWTVDLKPLEKKAIDFGFQVDVPNSYELNGL
jgi:uncharacterized protein (TIGR02231 family)